MRARTWIALSVREFRGSSGRLAFFAACLSVGVAAVVAVAGLSSAIDAGIQAQARQLLAGDIAISSRRALPTDLLTAVDALPGSRRAQLLELPSVVSVPRDDGEPGESLLCELKAVSGAYPFYGELLVEPAAPLDELLEDGGVVVGPELLERLGVRVGDPLRVGDARLTIRGTVSKEPDRLSVSFTLGPRVFLSLDSLGRSGLTGRGSRVQHRSLVQLERATTAEDVRQAAIRIRAAVERPEFVTVESYLEAQPSLRRSLGRIEHFLGLVALVSLLVGGIGVSQAVRAWIAGRMDGIAVLRALGVRPREVFLLFFGQTVALGLLGSVFGALVGLFVARAVPSLLADLLPVELDVGWQPVALLRGVGLGVGVAVLFALRPLTDVLRVPPALVLRRDAEPLPVSRLTATGLTLLLLIGVTATAAVQSGSTRLGVQFAGGLVAMTLALTAGSWLVVRGVAATPRNLGSATFRHGLAALARPGAGTLGAIVALGIGVLVVLGMYLVQDRLSAQLARDLPEDAPSVFLIDIQPDQWDGVRGALEDAGAKNLDSVEVVIGRLRAIDGVPVGDLVPERGASEDAGRRRWVLTREQRLTTMAELPEGNTVVEGALWSRPDRAEISIERDFADDLGARLGSALSFDIQGVPLELHVTSIRTVEWERFSINFFLVVEPGILDGAPRFRVAAARLDPSEEAPVQNRIAATFPNVTLLRVREVLDKVVTILEQVGLGVRLLGTFTVLAGIAILGGAISAGALRRTREVALYKTLGMTRAQVAMAFAVEYALIGLVAGTIGTAGGIALAWAVSRWGFDVSWAWRPGVYAAAIVSTVGLTVVAGLSASVRAMMVRPLAVLREE